MCGYFHQLLLPFPFLCTLDNLFPWKSQQIALFKIICSEGYIGIWGIYKNIYKRGKSGLIMEKDIGKIRKNDTTDIIVRLDDFGGRKGLTIREFVTSERYTGFTKSGVRILGGDFLNFREMINSVSLEDMKDVEGAEGKEKQKTFKPKAPAKKASENNEELPDY